MRRIEFEKYLGKRVKISLFDGEIISGFQAISLETKNSVQNGDN